ncbi:hypothetical protein COJ46_04900 [Bacillus sp. AFS077874]|uniref:hypothetical protein n=1 Tax=unclassified Bacillus (in: firmicutes) TaxID=185979 RepID=UPI000BEE0E51|nr:MULTISPECIES: hypothetical protein [unclassified Bacillus (in: firmicutes)]PEC47401.1 hypothetical protein CON00_21765 [Bacillus sp. AFS096315]PFM83129.1 hypothetical protein COJ46_04900 [Bacillus sp. AFS077874]
MDIELKNFSEKALKHMFIGSQLDGVKFGVGPGAFLIRFINYYNSNDQPRDLWLNIESKWNVFTSGNNDFPNSEDEMSELTEEEEYNLVFKLRREKVVDIKLGENVPHLFIVFQSGKTLFVNGHHNMYECWQAGNDAEYTGGDWLIVATPGDDIAAWVPDEF